MDHSELFDLGSFDIWRSLRRKLAELSHQESQPNVDARSPDSPKARTAELMAILNRSFEAISDELDLYALESLPQERAEIFLTYAACAAFKDKLHKYPLHMLAAFGDTSDLKAMLDTGAHDINQRDEDEQTPLKNAVDAHHYGQVQLLLRQPNIEVDPLDSQRWTPLHDACRLGFLDIVRLLCDTGHANIEAANGEGFTPLQIAAFGGHARILSFLLDRGADPTATGHDELTALHRAVTNNHAKAVEVLVRAKVDVNPASPHGATPLLRAVESADPRIVRMLLDAGADANPRNCDGITVLEMALLRGDEPILRMLLRRGATGCDASVICNALTKNPRIALVLLNHTTTSLPATMGTSDRGEDARESGPPPFLLAALGAGSDAAPRDATLALALATRLLQLGADCNAHHVTGAPKPLHLAALRGWTEVTRLLLGQPSIAVDARGGTNGSTPLWAAAAAGNTDIIKALTEAGADVNATADDGTTPLMIATSEGKRAAVRMLVDVGASCGARDQRGRTALVIASQNGHSNLAAFLAERMSRRGTASDRRPAEPNRGRAEHRTTPVSAAWLTLEALAGDEMPDPTGDREPGWLRERVVRERERVVTGEQPRQSPLTHVYAERELPPLLFPTPPAAQETRG
ncbi:hypothetical protein, variant [Cladophialophora immunda]|uniref:Uncharacterized protein n=1 Tax=Cladophialophora immunda TaxID=569365 RepID=A0A0D1ZVQ1_9EURO|nr:hypothetical protein, variant [Cladophialophora immunda]KIW32271.1 hypothetical protein, variant [Cladophialophora immunda]